MISPHPDDDAIGCGGTLRKHIVEGDIVRTVFLTSGEKGGHTHPPEETGPLREKEARSASKILGINHIEFWRQPDGALSATHQLVDRLSRTVNSWQPDMLYVTHNREMNPDHRAAARIVQRVLSRSDTFIVKPVVRMFEVWTPLQRMDDIVDISRYIQVKMAAIRAHKSQCEVMRFDEASLALSRYRGELHSWSGGTHYSYSEIFLRMRT